MTSPPNDRVSWLLRPDQPEWVRAGALAWLETGDDLHQCLDLDRAGHVRAVRDYHLIRAWLALDGPAGWQRALLLTDEIRAFASRAWPRLQSQDKPDPAWSALRRELWLAFNASRGCKFPQTPERIRDIVNSAGVYN